MLLVQRYTNSYFQLGHSRPAFQSLPLIHTQQHRYRQFVCPSSVIICFSPSTHVTVHNVHIQTATVVPWLRYLVAGLSPKTPGFDPRPVRDGICGGQSCTAASFSPGALLVSCQYHSTNAPYSYRCHINPRGANMFQNPGATSRVT